MIATMMSPLTVSSGVISRLAWKRPQPASARPSVATAAIRSIREPVMVDSVATARGRGRDSRPAPTGLTGGLKGAPAPSGVTVRALCIAGRRSSQHREQEVFALCGEFPLLTGAVPLEPVARVESLVDRTAPPAPHEQGETDPHGESVECTHSGCGVRARRRGRMGVLVLAHGRQNSVHGVS